MSRLTKLSNQERHSHKACLEQSQEDTKARDALCFKSKSFQVERWARYSKGGLNSDKSPLKWVTGPRVPKQQVRSQPRPSWTETMDHPLQAFSISHHTILFHLISHPPKSQCPKSSTHGTLQGSLPNMNLRCWIKAPMPDGLYDKEVCLAHAYDAWEFQTAWWCVWWGLPWLQYMTEKGVGHGGTWMHKGHPCKHRRWDIREGSVLFCFLTTWKKAWIHLKECSFMAYCLPSGVLA